MYTVHLQLLAHMTQWAFLVILTVAAALVIWRVTRSRISLAGLMTDKTSGEFSPGRLQLLLFTLMVAASFILAVTGQLAADDLIKASDKPA